MRKEFRGSSTFGPIFIAGSDIFQAGQQKLLINDLRIGSEAPDILITKAVASFKYAEEVSRYYWRDGAQRSLHQPVHVPALEGADEMELMLDGARIELTASTPTALANFETHLVTLQRLFTFAAQRGSEQLTLTVETARQDHVHIYARTPIRSVNSIKIDYRELPIRLGNDNAQEAITKWWALTDKLRPLPQTLSGVLAFPGFVESDFLFLATVLDRLGEEWVEAQKPLSSKEFAKAKTAIAQLGLQEKFPLFNVSPFGVRVEALTKLLPEEIWSALGVEKFSWLRSLKQHRNLIAHADEQRERHRKFMTGIGLRALRDANMAIISLLIAQHLGVNGDALLFAAERQRYRWIQRYTNDELSFTNSGIET